MPAIEKGLDFVAFYKLIALEPGIVEINSKNIYDRANYELNRTAKRLKPCSASSVYRYSVRRG
ncbi:hypothetical protein ACLB1M_28030 [Escherichia coli]